MPHFYEPLSDNRADDLIAKQLIEPGNELSDNLCTILGETVSGVLCAYPAEEQGGRQRAGLHQLGARLDRDEMSELFKHLQSLRGQIRTIEPQGMYLSRIAVLESCKGTPLASDLVARLIDQAGVEGVSLHVRADNRRAIAFYHRLGFIFTDEGGRDYRIMERR